jgi:hypothetical protein
MTRRRENQELSKDFLSQEFQQDPNRSQQITRSQEEFRMQKRRKITLEGPTE